MLIEKIEKQFYPMYVVTANGTTTIERSWADTKLRWHRVSGASQYRIRLENIQGWDIEAVEEFGTQRDMDDLVLAQTICNESRKDGIFY